VYVLHPSRQRLLLHGVPAGDETNRMIGKQMKFESQVKYEPIAPVGAVSRWRQKRGQLLTRKIVGLSTKFQRQITILDVGGTPEYWQNIDTTAFIYVAKIVILTNDEFVSNRLHKKFDYVVGTACDLSSYADKSFDLVHSNSVIEHVGYWEQQSAMAREVRRVGITGWVQTPAFSFPIEPHFKLPFIHWFGQPMRRMALLLTDYCNQSLAMRRRRIDYVNLLTKAEVATLFEGCDIHVERFCRLPKSYIVHW
jgi:hypothetical protein